MGEPARDGETRDSQDRLYVNPAGAERKNMGLFREICLVCYLVVAISGESLREAGAEVSRGRST